MYKLQPSTCNDPKLHLRKAECDGQEQVAEVERVLRECQVAGGSLGCRCDVLRHRINGSDKTLYRLNSEQSCKPGPKPVKPQTPGPTTFNRLFASLEDWHPPSAHAAEDQAPGTRTEHLSTPILTDQPAISRIISAYNSGFRAEERHD